ncbi:carboxymuconolactone decarboxylase family protein [Sciscionella sediminilitoris]|uniref:carboxymuconolactone decarboxylase family protein n=1 Tax=Sciscionella sediminilitoris TaxID=1445613 RepID=UPI0004DF7195|nr:carboxymuconolactone decarboxylase family protein [Sciscionella sp. SE31]
MRIQLSDALPGAIKHVFAMYGVIERAAQDAGLDKSVLELVKIRASQINGCAYCTDTHSRDAAAAGESQRRIFVLPVWRETELFSEVERAALELTEAMTRLSEHAEVPDEVYEQARKVLSEEQFTVIAWTAAGINLLNRLGVTSRKPLPAA